MISKIDHIGIAVGSLDKAISFYEKALGLTCEGRETVQSQKVNVAFFRVGECRIELLEPVSTDSPVARFIAKNGEGIHHVAFATNDIAGQLQNAATIGCKLINDRPVEGAHGKKVAFLHPSSAHGVLTELCTE